MSQHLILTCNARSASLQLDILDTSGWRITPEAVLPLPEALGPGDAAPMLRDGDRLWLAWRGTRRAILSYRIDPAARRLELIGDCPVEDSLCHLALAEGGGFLLAAGGRHGSVFAIGADGRISGQTSRQEIGEQAHCLRSHGNMALGTACRDDLLVRFDFDIESGTLSPRNSLRLSARSGPRHLVITPSGDEAYLLEQEGGAVVCYTLGEHMTERARLALVAPDAPAMGGEIALLGENRLLVSERAGNRLILLARPDTGNAGLRRLSDAPLPDQVRSFDISAGDDFVCSVGFRAHSGIVHEITENGSLVPRIEFATGERPSWVCLLPLM